MLLSLLLSSAYATERVDPACCEPARCETEACAPAHRDRAPGVEIEASSSIELPDNERDGGRDRDSKLSLEGAFLAMDSGGGAMWGLQMQGARNGFARIDHRTQTSGDSILRGTIGVDLLGWSRLIDLHVGASMAAAADLGERSLYGPVGVGLETGFGLNIRSFHLSTRYTRPFGDSPVARGVNERELRLTYDLSQDLSVFGNQLRINPDLREAARVNAYGVGLAYTF